MTLSLVAKSKGGTEASIGLSTKMAFLVLKKTKGKKKVPKLNEKLVHLDLHSSKESNGDAEFLLVLPLNNQPKKGKGGKHALKHPKVDKAHKVQDEEVKQKEPEKTSKEFLALLNTF